MKQQRTGRAFGKWIDFLPGNWFLPAGLTQRVAEHSSNQQSLQGIRTFLKLTDRSDLSVRRWTWWDDRRDRRTHGQLQGPNEERFPILKEPLPIPCQFRIGPCPALIHPETGVIFGLRVGDYLCLLRLPDAVRKRAISVQAVWPRSPLPTMRDLDLAELFGADWVLPNRLDPGIREFYSAAFQGSCETIAANG